MDQLDLQLKYETTEVANQNNKEKDLPFAAVTDAGMLETQQNWVKNDNIDTKNFMKVNFIND